MNSLPPIFLAAFFGIFHLLGGLAIGRAVRAEKLDTTLLAWGLGFGLLPLIFDWFFLLRLGERLYGFAGSASLLVGAKAGYAIDESILPKRAERAASSLAAGIATIAFGVLIDAILLKQVSKYPPVGAEWLFAGCLAVLPIFVGLNFAWLGASALKRGLSFDEVVEEEESKQEKNIQKAASRSTSRRKNG